MKKLPLRLSTLLRPGRRLRSDLDGFSVEFTEMLHTLQRHGDVAHGYETLMSTVRVLDSARSLKTILITSTQPAEGKSTVAANLALTMTLAGKKVLVIDTDWRKPRIHEIFGLENTQGFIDLVGRDTPVEEIARLEHVVQFATEPGGKKYALGVMTSGTANGDAARVIEPLRAKDVLSFCASAYDAVLLDSPPVLSVSDTSLLAPVVDGVLLILNTGAVGERDVLRAKERLELAGGNILGLVMNQFDDQTHGPGFHPYEKGYYG